MSCCPGGRAQPPAPVDPQPPPLGVRVAAAAAAAVRFALGGMRVLGPAEQQARMAACDGCPWRRGDECRACGCVLSIKSWMPAEHCPHGRWPRA
jgi:hypothetical protein